MWFIIVFILANFVGLSALFVALVLWRRESGSSAGWFASPRGLGALCVLAGGAGLAVGATYNLVRWITAKPLLFDPPVLPDWRFLSSLRLVGFVVACLTLLGVGAALLARGRPAGVSRGLAGKGPFAWSMAV